MYHPDLLRCAVLPAGWNEDPRREVAEHAAAPSHRSEAFAEDLGGQTLNGGLALASAASDDERRAPRALAALLCAAPALTAVASGLFFTFGSLA